MKRLMMALLAVGCAESRGRTTDAGMADTATGLASAPIHCQRIERIKCARRRARGEFDMGGSCDAICQQEAELRCAMATDCSGATWDPPSCMPTTDQTDLCEGALLEVARVHLVYSGPSDLNFPECNLCR